MGTVCWRDCTLFMFVCDWGTLCAPQNRRRLWTVCIHFRGICLMVLIFNFLSALDRKINYFIYFILFYCSSYSLGLKAMYDSTEYTECQAFHPVVRNGSPHPLTPRECFSFGSIGSKTDTHSPCGGGGGMLEPIPTMEQTLWYSRYTLSLYVRQQQNKVIFTFLFIARFISPMTQLHLAKKNAQKYLLHMLFDPATPLLFFSYFVLLSLFRPIS